MQTMKHPVIHSAIWGGGGGGGGKDIKFPSVARDKRDICSDDMLAIEMCKDIEFPPSGGRIYFDRNKEREREEEEERVESSNK